MAGLPEYQGIEFLSCSVSAIKLFLLEIDCLLSWKPKTFFFLATLIFQSILVITVILRGIVSVFFKNRVDIGIFIPFLMTLLEFLMLTKKQDFYQILVQYLSSIFLAQKLRTRICPLTAYTMVKELCKQIIACKLKVKMQLKFLYL